MISNLKNYSIFLLYIYWIAIFKGNAYSAAKMVTDVIIKDVTDEEPCSCVPRTFVRQRPGSRIFAASFGIEEEFPWHVGFVYMLHSNFFCSGSIISASYLLTAAHCFFHFDYSTGKYLERKAGSVMAVMGSRFRHPNGYMKNTEAQEYRQLKLQYVQSHDKYIPGLPVNDIAVVKLYLPIEINPQRFPICLAFKTPPDFEITRFSGWGLRSEEDTKMQMLLERSWLFIQPAKYCAIKNYSHFFDNASMLCVYNVGKKPCKGDDGGALYSYGILDQIFQVGIASFTWECTLGLSLSYPTFFTNVAVFYDWIKSVTPTIEYCKGV